MNSMGSDLCLGSYLMEEACMREIPLSQLFRRRESADRRGEWEKKRNCEGFHRSAAFFIRKECLVVHDDPSSCVLVRLSSLF